MPRGEFLAAHERTYLDRCHFMEIVARLCPEFLGSLRETVLPDFPTEVSARSMRRGYRDPAFAAIRELFEAWIDHFNIRPAEWLHRVALQTLYAWSQHPTMCGFDPGASPADFRDPPVTFTWDRDAETRQDFLKRIKAETAVLDRQPRAFNEQHAEWFVLYQFCELSPSEILNRWNDDHPQSRLTWGRNTSRSARRSLPEGPSVVQKGYEAMAERLGVPLRRPRRGRARHH